MSANYYRPPDNGRVDVNTDILQDLPQRHARETLIHQVAKKSVNANNVDITYCDVFQKLRTGRRCSCWVGDSAHGDCLICFGTGIVGGFSKMRTRSVIFDVTYPNVTSVNVSQDYESPTRPTVWTLSRNAVSGYVEYEMQIGTNVGRIDSLHFLDHKPQGTSLQYWIRSSNDTEYVHYTVENLEARLGFDRLRVRIEFKRINPTARLPKVIGIRLSYRTRMVTAFRTNIPRMMESRVLDDFGIYDSFSQQTFFMDNEVRLITAEDFIVNLHDKTRWKIVEVQNNVPFGVITSWDITCRLVQRFERYYKVPAGSTDTEFLPPEFVRSMQTDRALIEHLQIVRNNSTFLREPGDRTQFVDERIGHKDIPMSELLRGDIREV